MSKEKRYVVSFTGAKDNESGTFEMVAYKNSNGQAVGVSEEERPLEFTYEEGFPLELAKKFKRQTNGNLVEVKESKR